MKAKKSKTSTRSGTKAYAKTNKSFDEKFDKQIRAKHPDWFKK